MTTKAIRPRLMGWLDVGGKPHRVVVLELDGARAWVAWGTSKPRELICVPVVAPSSSASMMGLTATTYFYAANMLQVNISDVGLTDKLCPPGTFAELRQMLLRCGRSALQPAQARQPGEAGRSADEGDATGAS